jgi:hypothetical protein
VRYPHLNVVLVLRQDTVSQKVYLAVVAIEDFDIPHRKALPTDSEVEFDNMFRCVHNTFPSLHQTGVF